MKGWLDNYNDSKASAPEGFQGEGYSNVGRNYSPAWGGQFQNGGPIKPSQKNYKTKGEYNAALKSYNLNLHKYELANNPEKIKDESDKDYENRTKYFDFKVRQEENKNPVSKAYLEMKDNQNADPDAVTRTLRQIATSPVHVAYGIYNAANPHDLDKYKSRVTKNNEDLDLTNSSLDAASLLVPFDYGMKASPLWKQAATRTVKEVAEDEGFNLLKAGNKWINSFQMGGYVYPVNYVPQAQDGANLNTPEIWEKSIRNIEHQIGNPNQWSIDNYRQLQKQVNEYKFWRENTPEGKAVYDSHNEPNEYVVPLPDHLKMYKPLNMLEEVTPSYKMGGSIFKAQEGKELTFLQPTSDKLPEGYRFPYADPSSERAMSIGGENGEPAYLIPSFKYGKELYTPIEEFKRTGEHLGGPFKTWQEADEWENTVRHPAVENRETIMFPQEKFQTGGSMPGAFGFSYARIGAAPSNGKYAKKTMASAQNGKEMQYYQEGLDWKPKTISQNGSKIKYGTPEYEKAWKEGNIQSPNVNGEDVPYWGGELDEVTINVPKKEKNWLEQYRDKIVEENKDAGVLGAIIGTPISAITSLPQLMGMKALTGEMQRPSESIGFENKEGLFESPSSFGKHASNFVLDAVTDPTNLIGAGILTKENALAKLAASQESGLLSNAYKYNPLAFKPNESNWYRQVGKSAVDDVLDTGLVREAGEEVSPRMWGEFQDQIKRLQGDDALSHFEKRKQQMLAGRRPISPFFNKGELFYPMGRKPIINKKTGKLSKNPAGAGSADYLIETSLPNESFQPAYVKGMYLGVPEEIGSTAILKPNPELRNLENFNIYKKDWLQGYKKVPKQEDGGIIKDDRGQWDHPGEITEINSNDITMEGVPYDVLGVSDTGDTKLMKPGKNYKFKGKKVTEFPMAKNGLRQEQKGLQNLEDLTNFTNYNKPTNWLNKYN